MKDIIIVPCYNEQKRIDIEKFKVFVRHRPGVSFLFVNDGSTDSTLEVLEKLCSANTESFSFLSLPNNVGKAEAIRCGVLKTIELNPKYFGMWDADLAAPLDEIPDFCTVLDNMPNVQMVFGARVKLLGRTIERYPLRHYSGRVAASLISWTLDLPLYDTQCGAKLFRATDQSFSLFREPFKASWIFDVEIVARVIQAWRKGIGDRPEAVIYELPLREWRHKGDSKLQSLDYLRSLGELYLIYRTYLRNSKNS